MRQVTCRTLPVRPHCAAPLVYILCHCRLSSSTLPVVSRVCPCESLALVENPHHYHVPVTEEHFSGRRRAGAGVDAPHEITASTGESAAAPRHSCHKNRTRETPFPSRACLFGGGRKRNFPINLVSCLCRRGPTILDLIRFDPPLMLVDVMFFSMTSMMHDDNQLDPLVSANYRATCRGTTASEHLSSIHLLRSRRS